MIIFMMGQKTKITSGIPKFLETAPITPLAERLHGKYYKHLLYCNADRRKPIGTPGQGCICLRSLKDTKL